MIDKTDVLIVALERIAAAPDLQATGKQVAVELGAVYEAGYRAGALAAGVTERGEPENMEVISLNMAAAYMFENWRAIAAAANRAGLRGLIYIDLECGGPGVVAGQDMPVRISYRNAKPFCGPRVQ